jgi:hypothetical protein
MTADKTGEPTTVNRDSDRFAIAVEGQTVGSAYFADRDGQRVFYHTEVDEDFEGRGLATILVGEALKSTRDEGLRMVAVCKLVAAYLKKHHEFDDIADPVRAEILNWLKSR